MKTNLEFYKEKQEELLPIEEEIIKIIEEKKQEEYEEIIKKDLRLEIVYALSEIRENILNWYNFKENATILEIEPNFGEITGLSCNKANKVVAIEKSLKKAKAIEKRHAQKENLELIVGNLQDIQLSEQFDYIVITNIFEYAPQYIEGTNPFEELIKYAENKLKPNGKILLATDNKFGIQYWNGKRDIDNTKEYREITMKRKKNQCQLFCERQIRELLNNIKLNYKIYYIFPNYKMPNLIYDENHKMSKEDISRNFTCHIQDEVINFNENKALDRIVKEDKKIFNFFANSYFIEISKEQIENDVKYVTFTNYRKKPYRIVTIIKENEVIKKAVNELSEQHINNIIKNFEYLKQYNVDILEHEKDGEITSKYIKDYQRLDLELENIEDIEEFKNKFARIY